MSQSVCILLNPADRLQLEAIVSDRNRPLKHVQRARIILFSAERLAVQDVARRVGVSRPCVWRWQQRFGEEGPEGLIRDKTRPPGKAPLGTSVTARVLALTCWSHPVQSHNGPGVLSPASLVYRFGLSSAYGRLIVSSPIACAHSRHPATPPSRRRWKTSSAFI